MLIGWVSDTASACTHTHHTHTLDIHTHTPTHVILNFPTHIFTLLLPHNVRKLLLSVSQACQKSSTHTATHTHAYTHNGMPHLSVTPLLPFPSSLSSCNYALYLSFGNRFGYILRQLSRSFWSRRRICVMTAEWVGAWQEASVCGVCVCLWESVRATLELH